jgi:hypothetical protein
MNPNTIHQDNSVILFTHLMEMDSKSKYVSIFNSELTELVGDILLLGQAICASPKRFSKMMTLNLTKVNPNIYFLIQKDREMVSKIENIMTMLATIFNVKEKFKIDFNS